MAKTKRGKNSASAQGLGTGRGELDASLATGKMLALPIMPTEARAELGASAMSVDPVFSSEMQSEFGASAMSAEPLIPSELQVELGTSSECREATPPRHREGRQKSVFRGPQTQYHLAACGCRTSSGSSRA